MCDDKSNSQQTAVDLRILVQNWRRCAGLKLPSASRMDRERGLQIYERLCRHVGDQLASQIWNPCANELEAIAPLLSRSIADIAAAAEQGGIKIRVAGDDGSAVEEHIMAHGSTVRDLR